MIYDSLRYYIIISITNNNIVIYNLCLHMLEENEVVKLRQKYIDLYNTFDKNKLIAMKCGRLADLILKTPETWDAYNVILKWIYLCKLNCIHLCLF